MMGHALNRFKFSLQIPQTFDVVKLRSTAADYVRNCADRHGELLRFLGSQQHDSDKAANRDIFAVVGTCLGVNICRFM